MKLYLAGPMRGIPLFNYPAFDEAKETLVSRGHDVYSPADIDRDAGEDYSATRDPNSTFTPDELREFLERDLRALAQCDGVVLLPGWKTSKGALLEVAAANFLGLKTYLYSAFVFAAFPILVNTSTDVRYNVGEKEL